MNSSFKLILIIGMFAFAAFAQTPKPTPTPIPTLGLEQGFSEFETPEFTVKLVKSSQTLAALLPKGGNGFDFTPADFLEKRASNGFYHFGDIRFSVRVKGTNDWKNYSSAADRKPVQSMAAVSTDLAVSDLTETLPADCPLQVTRKWTILDGKLALNFELTNKTRQELEIGSLSIPLVFNNILIDRNLIQSNEIASFSDPYVGRDGGYIQVSRLKGTSPALVVVPIGSTPFEAYQLLQEPMRPQQVFEGMFEWMIHSKADSETKWKNTPQWNSPTSEILQPNATRKIGLKFLVSDEIRNIQKTLADSGRPLAVGIPGYILPNDIEGKLFVKSQSALKSFESEPKDSLSITKAEQAKNGWQLLKIRGNNWGRTRLTIKYADGTEQTVHYYLTKPSSQTIADFGNFLFTKQWYENPSDPFKRSPSIISFDRETNKPVEQDNRAWIAGLGDEAGSGSWLAGGMKEFAQPNAAEIAKYERFIDGVLWGGLQYKEGENKYGVRKSMFYYDPKSLPNFEYNKDFNWTTWASWKKDHAESVGRGYNYPHVVAAYWSMYRLARNNQNLVKNHTWDWYLEQAFQTVKFAFSRKADGTRRVDYVETGLMEGTVFLELLRDLKREGFVEKAAEVERLMKERTDEWIKDQYPFGSEMAWDSTGQEEIYGWCKYFKADEKATVTLNSIIGYTPTVPHWGYNGNSRRYWDFLYGGKLRRIERQIHHYGSGMNSIPLLSAFRDNPNDFYLLQTGYGGMMGALSNIDQEGFASAAFHTYNDTMKWDAYSGDYGPNFFGHTMNSGTYIVNHPDFGWQTFGGNLVEKGSLIKVTPLDSLRQRIYVAPFGLWLTLDSGRFEQIEIDAKKKSVKIKLQGKTNEMPTARLRIEQPAKITGIGNFSPKNQFKVEREAFVIPLNGKGNWIEIGGRNATVKERVSR